jgi:signal transduction histidine kinase
MSDAAAIAMAWAVAQLVIGLHNLSIHLRRPTDLEYLAFAMLCFGFAIYTFGAASLTDATSYADGTTAMRIAYVGAPVGLGAFCAFAALLDSGRGFRVVRIAIAWAVLGLFGNLAGLFFDPDDPAVLSPYLEPRLSAIGEVWVFGACVLIGLILYRVAGRAREDRDLRILCGGSLILVVAAIHDQLVHILGFPTGIYVLEHASVAVSCLFSHMLLERLANTERELEERTAEVAASYRQLSRAQEDLINKEQLAAVGGLSAVIAHEIRNPLAILRNAASGLRRRGLTRQDRETLLGILDEESDRLGRLSNDLATYARPLDPSSEPVHVEALLEECAAEARSSAGADVEIVTDLAVADDLVEGDPALLRNAMRNIVENALQAMRHDGRLTIRTSATELRRRPAIQLEVEDTGEGMDTLVHGKAVDPFFTTRASGTGLGLAIVDRVVRAHGGELSIRSRFGQGTTVILTLPTTEGAP